MISLDMSLIATYQRTLGLVSNRLSHDILQLMVWYGIVEFNVPLDTVRVYFRDGGPEQ